MQAPNSGMKQLDVSLFPKWKRIIDKQYKLLKYYDISLVNKIINHNTKYVAEGIDYWQTPVELITNKKGDCEDFAIAKYFFLYKAFPCFLAIGELKDAGPHCVCVIYSKTYEQWVVLDCITDQILGYEQYLSKFNLLYLLNHEGAYTHDNTVH